MPDLAAQLRALADRLAELEPAQVATGQRVQAAAEATTGKVRRQGRPGKTEQFVG